MNYDLIFTELPDWNLALTELTSRSVDAVGGRTATLAEVGIPGAQGPAGPAGPTGSQGPTGPRGVSGTDPTTLGASRTFAVAVDTWVLDHGLGWVPSIETYNLDGQQIEGTIISNTVSSTTVVFYLPVSGRMTAS